MLRVGSHHQSHATYDIVAFQSTKHAKAAALRVSMNVSTALSVFGSLTIGLFVAFTCVISFANGKRRSIKTFMVRVFLPPAPGDELYINIGYCYGGNQVYPEWMPLFREAISKEDYDRFIAKIKAYFDANVIPM